MKSHIRIIPFFLLLILLISLSVSGCSFRPKDMAETPAEAPAGGPEDLSSRLAWVYPMAWAQELPSKITATALRRQSLTREDAEALAPEDRSVRAARRPDFRRADGSVQDVRHGNRGFPDIHRSLREPGNLRPPVRAGHRGSGLFRAGLVPEDRKPRSGYRFPVRPGFDDPEGERPRCRGL